MRKVALAVSVLLRRGPGGASPQHGPLQQGRRPRGGAGPFPWRGPSAWWPRAAGVPLLLGQVPEVTVKGRVQGTFREVLDLLVRV